VYVAQYAIGVRGAHKKFVQLGVRRAIRVAAERELLVCGASLVSGGATVHAQRMKVIAEYAIVRGRCG
jgi:hypothetical protein